MGTGVYGRRAVFADDYRRECADVEDGTGCIERRYGIEFDYDEQSDIW